MTEILMIKTDGYFTFGPAAALRFLTLLHHEPTDYAEISHRLYEGQTIEDIFGRAKKHWKD